MEEDKISEEEVIEQEPWHKGPVRYILTIFLLLIIVTWTFALYGGRLNPEPKRIPAINEVLPYIELTNQTFEITTKQDYYKLLNPTDPAIKQTADSIAAISCDGSRVCQAKAMYYFIRDNYEYISDPVNQEYVEDPKEFLKVGGGDCESGAIALANLLESIGVSTEFVIIPNHAL